LTALCEENGVEIVYNTLATPETVKAYEPYAVFCAVGSSPLKPFFKGKYRFEDILTFEDVLTEKVKLENKKVAVIGSGMTGLETADFLGEKGCKVTVVEMAPVVAPGTWMQHTDDILPRLAAQGAEIRTGERLCELYPDRIVTENVKNGTVTETEVDAVVLALGSGSNTGLAAQMKAAGLANVAGIGDAVKVGRIQNATSSAYRAAVALR
ncbi:MAG: FAD-dependent oxidoreductase, partial [Clostridia bacterium]|nr:FAD-dependent oxidoreductase [Clostridia bacterium]